MVKILSDFIEVNLYVAPEVKILLGYRLIPFSSSVNVFLVPVLILSYP